MANQIQTQQFVQMECVQKGSQFNWVLLNGIGVCLEQADGIPTDSDGDGVPDSQDQCVFEIGTVANNGCPEGVTTPQDTDGDGVIDSEDQCPLDFGTVANNGCPEGVIPPPEPEGTLIDEVINGDIVILTTITFEDGTT